MPTLAPSLDHPRDATAACTEIYIVDDHAIVRDGLRAMLENSPHRVVGEAAEPQLALAGILALRPSVLLLDLHLDERSGFDLLRDLRSRRAAPRTLVLTMSVQPRDVAEAVRLGVAGYLLKDSPRSELLRAIDAVARGARYFGPEVEALADQAWATPRGDAELLATLSPRELEVTRLVVAGHTSQAIGARLALSPKTVDTYRSRLMGKLGVADVTALVRFAIRSGLISAEFD